MLSISNLGARHLSEAAKAQATSNWSVTMPRYAVLVYWPEAETPGYGTPEFQQMASAYAAFTTEIGKTGVMKSSEGLQPTSTATTVRVREGKTLTTDGPFAETREQLGGVWLFDCKDLDEAISWSAKIPQAQNGSVEIRPLWQQSTESWKP